MHIPSSCRDVAESGLPFDRWGSNEGPGGRVTKKLDKSRCLTEQHPLSRVFTAGRFDDVKRVRRGCRFQGLKFKSERRFTLGSGL